MATCLKEVDQNKKLSNAASFVMKHLHRMKVPRKQEHLPKKDTRSYKVLSFLLREAILLLALLQLQA